MKNFKRVMCVALAVVMALSVFTFVTAAENSMTVTVATVSAKAGEEVTAAVSIPAGFNFSSGAYVLTYDNTVLEIVSADKGALESLTINKAKAPNQISCAYATTTPLNVAGSILNVVFKIKADAAAGSYPLTLTAEDFTNDALTAITTTIVNGAVTVTTAPAADPVLKYYRFIDFERIDKDVNLSNKTPGFRTDETAFETVYEDKTGDYQVKAGVGANGTAGLVVNHYLGVKAKNAASWGAMAFAPAYTDPTNKTGFIPATMNNELVGAATEFVFWIDTTGFTKYKLIKEENEDGEEVVTGREDTPVLSKWSSWLGIWDDSTGKENAQTCYCPEVDKPMFIQKDGQWVEVKTSAINNDISLEKGYKGYVRIPRTSFEGIWGAYGDIRTDEVGKYKDSNGVVLTAPTGDNKFNGPFQKISFNGNMGGFEYEGAKVVFDDFGFIGYDNELAAGLTLTDIPSPVVVEPSTNTSTDVSTVTPGTSTTTSTPNASIPGTGSTGVAGMASALAIAALATVAAVCFKKR